jgi:hypothetical protein
LDPLGHRARRALAVSAITCAALLLGTSLRTADRASVAPIESLEAALERAAPAASVEPAPTLLLLVDLECASCARAQDDLRYEVLPEALGVRTCIVLHSDEEELANRGLLPAYYLFDENRTYLGGLRGYRPPEPLRAWMRERLGLSPAP